MSEVTTQAKPERRKRQKLEDMEGYKPSIYGLTRDELIDWAMEHGEKKFRATQIWDWLYKKRVQSFEEMTNISKDFIAKLNENFCVNPLKQRIVQESKDGTVKYLFELPDGMLIETVLMRQHYGLSVCVTTQVGCNIGCTFCASGLIKKQRDLTAGEIVAQIMLVQKYLTIVVTVNVSATWLLWVSVSHLITMTMCFASCVPLTMTMVLPLERVTLPYQHLVWHQKSRNLLTKVFKLTLPYHFTRLTMTFVQASCVSTARSHLKNSLKLSSITSRQPTVV